MSWIHELNDQLEPGVDGPIMHMVKDIQTENKVSPNSYPKIYSQIDTLFLPIFPVAWEIFWLLIQDNHF